MGGSREVKLKAIYTIVEREGASSRWVRIGIGFVNSDGSINVRLDAVPVNGRLHVRDHQRRRKEKEERGEGSVDSNLYGETPAADSVFDSNQMARG